MNETTREAQACKTLSKAINIYFDDKHASKPEKQRAFRKK